FCKSYNIPLGLENAVRIILNGYSKESEIGKIYFMNKWQPEFDNQPFVLIENSKTAFFACCANIGLGAALARQANSGIRKITGDFLGTFISLLKILISYRASDYIFELDDKKQTLKKVHNISIGKTPYIASGIKVNHKLNEYKNAFYNLLVQNLSFRKLPYVLKTLYKGEKIKNNETISLHYGKNFKIYGNGKNPEVEFDGDPQGFLPCEIETAEDKLDLIVPVPQTTP
ncbi:MAG: diacylglycerol kinase, partial [Calditrichia bacterium]|nr:diacylglycerol kinase [Calditrichia bacterium]